MTRNCGIAGESEQGAYRNLLQPLALFDRVGGMHEFKQVRALHIGGAVTEQALEAGADKLHVAQRVEKQGRDLRSFSQRAKAPLARLDQPVGMTTIGDVLNSAVKVERLADIVVHNVRVLADPDALTRFVAINLGDKGDHLPVALYQCREVVATIRGYVPLGRNVVDAREHLRFAGVTVELNECCASAQLPTRNARPISADRKPVEERGKVFRRNQHRARWRAEPLADGLEHRFQKQCV